MDDVVTFVKRAEQFSIERNVGFSVAQVNFLGHIAKGASISVNPAKGLQ